MNTHERFQAIANFEPFDRLPLLEWAGWWNKTIDRWHSEGLPEDLTDRYDICRHFGLDIYLQDWIMPKTSSCPDQPSHGAGILTNEDEYSSMLEHLYPLPAVNRERWEEWAVLQEKGEAVLWFTVDGFFWFARKLLGIERHLYAFYDQANLMHRINTDLSDWILKVIDELCEVCTPAFMTFAEDMSFNHGPMLSKDLFDEFMRPYYDRVIPELKKRGIVSIIDSDGDIAVPAYWFEEAGLEGILPLERQAGVDIAQLRKDHPDMKFMGHYDKMVMNKGEEAMRKEFERLLPTAAQGGFFIGCDHQTPPGVSYEDYNLYISLFGEYAEQAGSMSGDT